MNDLRDIDLGTPKIRSRYFAWEIPIAIAIAVAAVIVAMHFGVKIELWESASKWLERNATKIIDPETPPKSNIEANTSNKFRPSWNPFLESPNRSARRYHPFIGQTVPSQAIPNFARDYFGFRNKENLYFEPCDCRLVVVSGNSEVAGTGLYVAWTEHLERILNERSNEKWCVLNLGMSGITTSYEVNSFVNLAYNLKPDFVISHSLVGDVHHGLKVPLAFRKLGLIYIGEEETWARKIHGTNINTGAFNFEYRDKTDGILSGFLTSVKRYKSIVEGNGGQFILGIPRFEMSKLKGRTGSTFQWPIAQKIHHELTKKLEHEDHNLEYIDFNKPSYRIETSEGVHSEESSGPRIAKIYADRILKLLRTPKNN